MPTAMGKELVTQRTPFEALSRFGGVIGKRVLEVGGNSSCIAALPFAVHGAAVVVVTGLYHMDIGASPPHSLITLETADALQLTEKYSEGSFDLVYGVSILEHIPNHSRFLSEVSRVLSKGGVAFLQGAPVWTDPWGHHIHLTPWQDNTIGCYQFLPAPDLLENGVVTFNPIPDWGHLLYTREQLYSILAGTIIPEQDVKTIFDAVYDADVICRESVNSILSAVADSGLIVIEMEFDRVHIPDNIRDRLHAMHKPDEDYSIMGVRMVLKKR